MDLKTLMHANQRSEVMRRRNRLDETRSFANGVTIGLIGASTIGVAVSGSYIVQQAKVIRAASLDGARPLTGVRGTICETQVELAFYVEQNDRNLVVVGNVDQPGIVETSSNISLGQPRLYYGAKSSGNNMSIINEAHDVDAWGFDRVTKFPLKSDAKTGAQNLSLVQPFNRMIWNDLRGNVMCESGDIVMQLEAKFARVNGKPRLVEVVPQLDDLGLDLQSPTEWSPSVLKTAPQQVNAALALF